MIWQGEKRMMKMKMCVMVKFYIVHIWYLRRPKYRGSLTLLSSGWYTRGCRERGDTVMELPFFFFSFGAASENELWVNISKTYFTYVFIQ